MSGSDIDRLRERLGGVKIDAMQGDNLAITLCTHFDDPDEENEDETCWGPSALNGANATLDAIHAHYATALAERDATIERLEKSLRTVQNAAKTIASCHGTELEHLRQNYAFDHKLRAEVESLHEANSLLTEQTDAAEARSTAAERERDEARAEVERKDAALSLYADRSLYVGLSFAPEPGAQPLLAADAGAIARAALRPNGGDDVEG